MGTHPTDMAVASGLGRLSLVKTDVRSAGISARLATGIRRVIPGNSTDPLGKGRMGSVWDLLCPIVFRTSKANWLSRGWENFSKPQGEL